MSRDKFRKIIALFCITPVLNFIFFAVASAQGSNNGLVKANIHPKISYFLNKLEEEYSKGAMAARLFARSRNMRINGQDRVTIYIMSTPGTTIDEADLQSLGAKVIKRAKNTSKATVPMGMLTAIADTVKGVSFIKTSDDLIPVAVDSEGVALTGAATYHDWGYIASGVRLAVIDVGFAGLSSAISNGDLPGNVVKIDCTGASCVSSSFSSETEPHGTAVAEIVFDMAPGILLYLIKITDTLDLEDAKDYAISNGIRIINHALVVANTNFYDGECWTINPVCTANDAYANNILWVNAAGNEAERHYEAVFTDPEPNAWHNVSGIDEKIDITANTGDTINVYLTWDAWPRTNQDYDLYLYNSSDIEVDSSLNPQTGTQLPTEEIIYSVPANGIYYLKIRQQSATSNHRLEIYSVNHRLTPAVNSSSLLTPADAVTAIAVGAINYNVWTTGPQEFFSSQGPTNDNRIKPDICGPDRVSNDIYGTFAGTSASCAHVAGAAALLLGKNPGYSVDQLWDVLISSAIDMGSSGNDNIYGYGRLNLTDNGVSGTGGDGGSGGCFIATAAFGSPMSAHVKILRKMRDRFFLASSIGKRLVNLYYQHSPPLAKFITDHEHFRMLVRISILPLVGVSWLVLKLGPLFTIFLMILVGIGVIRLTKLINFLSINSK